MVHKHKDLVIQLIFFLVVVLVIHLYVLTFNLQWVLWKLLLFPIIRLWSKIEVNNINEYNSAKRWKKQKPKKNTLTSSITSVDSCCNLHCVRRIAFSPCSNFNFRFKPSLFSDLILFLWIFLHLIVDFLIDSQFEPWIIKDLNNINTSSFTIVKLLRTYICLPLLQDNYCNLWASWNCSPLYSN